MILIRDDASCEMLEILKDGNRVFYGNYWDLDSDSSSLKNLLEQLDLNVVVDSNWKCGE